MATTLVSMVRQWVGLSSDTKPTADVTAGSRFFETDTRLTYIYNNSAWTPIKIESGLVFAGTCDSGMTGSKTSIVCADLAGYGNDYFNDKFYVQIIKNADSIGAAPDNEIRLIKDYVTATGTITTESFSANVEETDEILILHSSIIASASLQTELDAFILTDYDDFDVADADADTERWTPGYIAGSEGAVADINTTVAGKLYVLVDPDATPTAARYGVKKSLPCVADYFTVTLDVDCTWGSVDSATAKAVGLLISSGIAYDANNFIMIERQKGTSIDRIQANATINGAAQTAVNASITDDALAFKIERWDNVWRVFYSEGQSPVYSWILLAQFEDPSDYMTPEVSVYNEVYTVGSADAETVQGDFDNFRFYIASGGGYQYVAGDYDSTYISNNIDGNVLERLEVIQQALQAVTGGGSGFEADGSGATVYNTKIAKYGEAEAGGDTNTLIDSALTEANDYWNGQILVMLSGNNAGLARPIVDSVLATTSLEIRPAFPNAIAATDKYCILTDHIPQAPSVDSTENYLSRDVIGNKEDASSVAASTVSIVALLRALASALNITVAGTGSGFEDDGDSNIVKALGTDGVNITDSALSILGALGANNANNAFNSATVAANASGSVLERLEDILTTYLTDGTIGLTALKALIDALESTYLNDGTIGLSALKDVIGALDTTYLGDATIGLSALKTAIGLLDTTYLGNATIGLANLKVLIDALVTTYLGHATIGLSALKDLIDVIDGYHDVPTKDSLDNVTMRDVIGTKTDEEESESLHGLAYTINRHNHNVAKTYPYLAAGLTITGSNTALTLGTKVEVIPVATDEVNTITITAAATGAGTVTIWLNGVPYQKEVAIGTTGEVAAELRSYSYGDWVASGTGDEVIFTKSGKSDTALFIDTDTTGVTVSIVKTTTGAGVPKYFDIHYVFSGAAAVGTYILTFYKGAAGAEEIIGSVRVVRTANTSEAASVPVMTPLLPAGTRVSAAVASVAGGEQTMVISVGYHEY